MVLNTQSIKSPGKPAQLQTLIRTANADIVIGSKSWLNQSISISEVFPPDFTCYRNDRSSGKGGGVFLLVSNQYDSYEPEELKAGDECELVWAKLKVQGSKDPYIGSFYRPPENHDPECLNNLQKYIARIPTHNGAHLWIGGDFNLADIDWNDECVKPYPSHGPQCQQLLTISRDAFLTQMVAEPTRITETSANTLELFFTSNDTLVNQTRVIPGISDHEAVFIESSLRPIKKPTCPRRLYKYHKADYDGFKWEMRDFTTTFQDKVNSMDINTIWQEFKSTIHRLMEKYIPHKPIRGNRKSKPWITRTIRALHRKKNKLFKKQRATKGSKDIDNYQNMKAKVQRAERQAYWKYVENLIEVGNEDTDHRPGKQKRFWSYIKSLRKDNSGVSPLKENGKMHADPLDKSNILNRQYESIFTREDDTNIPLLEGQPYPPMPDIEVSTDGS